MNSRFDRGLERLCVANDLIGSIQSEIDGQKGRRAEQARNPVDQRLQLFFDVREIRGELLRAFVRRTRLDESSHAPRNHPDIRIQHRARPEMHGKRPDKEHIEEEKSPHQPRR